MLCGCLLASRATAQMHGYVEPCNPLFIEDGRTICEECEFDHSNPKSCAAGPGARGYTFKCRTGGHSAPLEVWCKPRGPEVPRELVLAGVVAGVLLFTAGFLWWKRRSRA